jgi:hypothetical protein
MSPGLKPFLPTSTMLSGLLLGKVTVNLFDVTWDEAGENARFDHHPNDCNHNA